MQKSLAEKTPWLKIQKQKLETWTRQNLKFNLSQYFRQDYERNQLATHFILLTLVVAILIVGGIQWSDRRLTTPRYISPQLNSTIQETANVGNPLTLSSQISNQRAGIFQPAAVLQTIIPDRTVYVEEISTYEVQSGDTLFGIAAQFGLSPETLLWANKDLEDNPDLLSLGQKITILPVDGVYHQVGSEDTLEGIASTFKVTPDVIVNYQLNQLDPESPQLVPGQWLIIPGGEKPYVPKYVSVATSNAPGGSLSGTGSFNWPTNGTVTQEFWRGHRALDIGAWMGAPIYAADSGYVTAAGWDDSGYGRMIIIDHGNGFKTLYAHLSVLYVSAGDEVSAGQQIGEMGSTGNSTGPHLHFEVILNGVQRNPWGFLP